MRYDDLHYYIFLSFAPAFVVSPFLKALLNMTTFPVPLVPKSYTEFVLFTYKELLFRQDAL